LNQQSTILDLKFPVKLAAYALEQRRIVYDGTYKKKTTRQYTSNRHIKNLMSFVIMKALTQQGKLNNYRNQLGYLATVCQCSKKTMLQRIEYMQEQQLITIEGADIRLNGWKQVCSTLRLNCKQFTTIIYDYAKDKNIFLRFFAAEIETNKEQQAHMIKVKLQHNPALKLKVQATMLQHGADRNRIDEFAYLLNGMRLLYKQSFKVEPQLHELLCKVRPDCNRGVKAIASAWEFNSKQLVSYYKAKLAASEIAVIHKGERITSQKRARNEFAHVMWNKQKKQTVLSLVDSITIISKKVAA
jgi:hypothetical protein